MRVKMLVDAPGSPDGVTVNEYEQDSVYEVTEGLGDAFVAYGLATETTDDVTGDEPEQDEAGEDTENRPRRSRKATAPDENK